MVYIIYEYFKNKSSEKISSIPFIIILYGSFMWKKNDLRRVSLKFENCFDFYVMIS